MHSRRANIVERTYHFLELLFPQHRVSQFNLFQYGLKTLHYSSVPISSALIALCCLLTSKPLSRSLRVRVAIILVTVRFHNQIPSPVNSWCFLEMRWYHQTLASPSSGLLLRNTYMKRHDVLILMRQCTCYDYSIAAIWYYQRLPWCAYWDVFEAGSVEQQDRFIPCVEECSLSSVAHLQYG